MIRRDEESLMQPPLENLLARIPQKYELVLTATKRAKQIIREQRLNPGALDDSHGLKPLSIALRDIAEGRVDKEVLLTPDVEFDEVGEADELQSEIERMGVLPFTTRPAVDYSEPAPSGSLDDFADDDDDDDEDLDLEDVDTDDEAIDPFTG
jgi:DNA-directed RNA polymerase omega subunit